MNSDFDILGREPNRWHAVGIHGVFVARFTTGSDARGSGCKVLDVAGMAAVGVTFTPVEAFYLVTHAGVLRGIHADHAVTKVIICVSGKIHEVLLDLRPDSPGRGHRFALDLSPGDAVCQPPGVAHGFLNTGAGDAAVLIHASGAVPGSAFGVRWDSFGHTWPAPCRIVSERDRALPEYSYE